MRYFAYGSNMDPGEMKKEDVSVLSREAAKLEDHRLAFNKRSTKWAIDGAPTGAANVMPEPGAAVEGVLYETDEAGIAKLDLREGLATGQYYRTEVTVRTAGGSEATAVTYMACPDKIDDALRPSKAYLARLLNGVDLLSAAYLETLKKTPTAD